MPLAALGDRQLIVVTGKGGVGKTVLTAALGRLLASRGRRVMLAEVDPRQSLHHALGLPPSEGEPARAADRLWVLDLQPRLVLEDLVRTKLKVAALARRVTASPVFQTFADGAPGFRELALMGHALRLARGDIKPRVDVVILDAPATGHGLSLLIASQLVADVITKGPVGALAKEVSAFVADADRCAVVVATTAAEMPVQEALELMAQLRERFGRGPELVIANGLYPPLPGGRASRGRFADEARAALELWTRRRAISERELARLARAWDGPIVELPLLPLAGPPLVDALTARLAAR